MGAANPSPPHFSWLKNFVATSFDPMILQRKKIYGYRPYLNNLYRQKNENLWHSVLKSM